MQLRQDWLPSNEHCQGEEEVAPQHSTSFHRKIEDIEERRAQTSKPSLLKSLVQGLLSFSNFNLC